MANKIESIQVLGPGCPSCKKLFELAKQAAAELDLEIEVGYSDDIQKMIALGVMSSPVLVVNEKAVLAGQLPGMEKLKEILTQASSDKLMPESSQCSCGGNC